MSKISVEEAYDKLVKNRERENPKVFAVFKGTEEEKLARKLYNFGFFQLERNINRAKGLGGRFISVYRLVGTPHTPPKFN